MTSRQDVSVLNRLLCAAIGHNYDIAHVDTDHKIAFGRCIHCGQPHEYNYQVIEETWNL